MRHEQRSQDSGTRVFMQSSILESRQTGSMQMLVYLSASVKQGAPCVCQHTCVACAGWVSHSEVQYRI